MTAVVVSLIPVKKLRVDEREHVKLSRCLVEGNENDGANGAAGENKAGVGDARAVQEEMEEMR